MADEITTTVYFAWKSVMPDRRQWKPSSPILELENTMVAVNIPLNKEHIYNFERVAVELEQDKDVEPILTPLGMRYCIDELEKVMSETELPVDNNPNWEAEKKVYAEKMDTLSNTPVDDWAANIEFDEGDAGKADEELWKGNAEDWNEK